MESNSTISKQKKFLLKLREDNVRLNQPLSEYERDKFELSNNIKLPLDLISLLYLFDGFADDEMYNMYRIWSLHEFKKITQYFSTDILRSQDLNFERKGKGQNKDDSLINNIIDKDGKWLIPNADNYFLFADYNINGSYWAIRLTATEELTRNSIICLNDSVNTYSNVAADFSEFLEVLTHTCPENLL